MSSFTKHYPKSIRSNICQVFSELVKGSSKASNDLRSSSVTDRGPPCIVLRTNRKWVGASKWIVRALNQYDEKLAEQLVEAFDLFHRTGDKNKVFQLVDKALEPYGGQLFEGFSVGKSVNGFNGRGGAQ